VVVSIPESSAIYSWNFAVNSAVKLLYENWFTSAKVIAKIKLAVF